MRNRSFLKWAGSKYSLINKIVTHFPQAKRLIEPFAGSAVVCMNTDFHQYLLAEDNHDLINIFTQIKNDGASFIQYCEKYFSPENNCADKYLFFREYFNQCTDLKERAALFLYLNRHGYNGLCRYNHKGKYNVPFGRYLKPYFPRKEMEFFYQRIDLVELLKCDYKVTFNRAQKGDLIYCDPPYSPLEQTSNFSAYTKNQFNENEHIHLAELASQYAELGITVIISNHDTEFTRYQYRNAEIIPFSVKRLINCKPSERRVVKELLAIFS
jgi:DNA adenine methylase